MVNISVVTVLTLSGVNETLAHRAALFCLTSLCYCVILLVNITIIVTIVVENSLHEPMYIFLCNMCVNMLYGTAGFYPRFLWDLLSPSHVISHTECLVQGYIIHSSVCCDFSILALMAYDRYVAICRPLVYHSVMTKLRISLLVCVSWLLPLCLMFMNTITMSWSKLCGSRIQRIYCVNYMVGKIACSVSKANGVIAYFNISFYVVHAGFIVWSYAFIIRTCRGSKENRGKFMQTCCPHLISLVNIVVALLFDLMYMRFGTIGFSESLKNFIAIEFLVVPPVINPFIYGFKLTKLRGRILHFVGHERQTEKSLDKTLQ